jgi:hypothetical protein
MLCWPIVYNLDRHFVYVSQNSESYSSHKSFSLKMIKLRYPGTRLQAGVTSRITDISLGFESPASAGPHPLVASAGRIRWSHPLVHTKIPLASAGTASAGTY